MAILGITKLRAVNEILSWVGHDPVGALDSSPGPPIVYTQSIQSKAERTLDEVSERLQMGGFGNVEYGKKYTLASPGEITVGVDVLMIRSTNPLLRERYTLREDKVYDMLIGSTTLPAGDYFFDVTSRVPFELLPNDAKVYITLRAAAEFQFKQRGDPQMALAIAQLAAISDIEVKRALRDDAGLASQPVYASMMTQQRPQQ